MSNVEVRCPRCGAPCRRKSSATDEFVCENCGSTFRFMDPTKRTVVRDTPTHNCPSCGAPVKSGEGFACTECGRDEICSKCVRELAGKYICKECIKKKMYIIGPYTTCPSCNGQLSYVKEYNRWYCYNCQSYPVYLCKTCGGL